MARTQRIGAAVLAVVSLGLTVTGVVLAATDSHPNPGARAVDPLALNGYPPSTATLAISVDAGATTLSGTIGIDFRHDAAQASLNLPLGVTAIAAQLILTPHHLYIGSSNLSGIVGQPWLAESVHTPSLYDWSLEATHPDVTMIQGYQSRTVTHAAGVTTYHFTYLGVHLAVPGLLRSVVPSAGRVDVSVSVGSQNEFTGATVVASSSTATASLTATVLGYNQPLHIAGPPRSQVRPLTPGVARRILRGLSGISQLLGPGALGGGGATAS
ncbi:MAG: hypothetical protein ACP5OV_03240 [Acidimicrobiales bacterium]